MSDTAFSEFWNTLFNTLTLNPEAYRQINSLPGGLEVALLVVLLVGISEAIGQCIVLFVNKVKPFRFVFSLLVAAILFSFTFGFWALSTWGIANFLFGQQIPIFSAVRTLGLSYAPQIFSFLEALPYIGVPIGVLLTIWSLLSSIEGLEELTRLDMWQVFASTGLGWLVLQLLQRTVGRPIVAFGQWLSNVVAGTTMITDPKALREMLLTGTSLPPTFTKGATELATAGAVEAKPIRKGKRWILLAVLGTIAFAAVLLLSPGSLTWYQTLGEAVQLAIKLGIVALVAILVAILLTPFESLQWWAGWYGDEPLDPGMLVEPAPTGIQIARYVTYLDGINQGSENYLPEVEGFLDRLAERLPPNVVVVKGIMPYSPINRPLTKDNLFAFFWRILDSIALKHPTNPAALLINIRNVVAVAVAADQRYAPIQNQGLARVLYNSLMHYGYQPDSGTPVSMIGYSGGGQMSMGAVTFLKRYLGNPPIEVISISGVISGNTGAMEAEHVYHLVGQKDLVEKLGPIMFPGRWASATLSNWNRAKRRGRISFISLGPVGHNGRRGPFGIPTLPDGRTYLEQTVDLVTGILLKNWAIAAFDPTRPKVVSNFELYQQAPFNHHNYYPLNQSVDPNLYRPIGTWMGRLILPTPKQRQPVRFVWFEVHHADAGNQQLIGQVVKLKWHDASHTQEFVQLVTQDVNFAEHVEVSKQNGNIHPDRLDRWQKVDPLESLTGARPDDDVIVLLSEPVVVEENSNGVTLQIEREPIQISGRYYALVTIAQALGNDRFKVRHYNRTSQQFDGPEEVVLIPTVIPNRDTVMPSTNHQIEQSPVNPTGWYIYGAKNGEGTFVVQSMAPRKLFALKPDRAIVGERASLNYINHEYWKDIVAQKGQVNTMLLNLAEEDRPLDERSIFSEGTRALLLHVYGGIGGNKKEFAPMGIFFGHFAFGVATIIREPLTGELRFDLEYRQVYTHNSDGFIAGTNGWSRYIGDRQFGWLGSRPISDIIIHFPPLTQDYDFDGIRFSPLQDVLHALDVMAARYRIGDGTGTTFVSPVNSCVQDSSHALYSALRRMMAKVESNPAILKWLRDRPDHEQTRRFKLLADLAISLEDVLTPLGILRSDWKDNRANLGSFPQETPLRTLFNTLASWRSLLPRLTNDLLAMLFLQLGATLWAIRTNQIGGYDPDIEPIAPTDFSCNVPRIKRAEVER